MPVTKSKIERNLQKIRQDVANACARARRTVEEVLVLPVTKTVGLEEVKSLVEMGVADLAESHVQQLVERAEELAAHMQRKRAGWTGPVRWHMVGHLQRNKVNALIDAADVVHSVDSLRLAEAINARAERMERKADVLLQVNCSDEAQKFGCAVGAAVHLAEMIGTLKSVRLVGLMTLAPLCDDPEGSRPSFVRLRELFDEMQHERIGGEAFRHLSMGMSNDYAVAVEEGATILRVGRAVFA